MQGVTFNWILAKASCCPTPGNYNLFGLCIRGFADQYDEYTVKPELDTALPIMPSLLSAFYRDFANDL